MDKIYLNRYLTKVDTQMANKDMKRCSIFKYSTFNQDEDRLENDKVPDSVIFLIVRCILNISFTRKLTDISSLLGQALSTVGRNNTLSTLTS